MEKKKQKETPVVNAIQNLTALDELKNMKMVRLQKGNKAFFYSALWHGFKLIEKKNWLTNMYMYYRTRKLLTNTKPLLLLDIETGVCYGRYEYMKGPVILDVK